MLVVDSVCLQDISRIFAGELLNSGLATRGSGPALLTPALFGFPDLVSALASVQSEPLVIHTDARLNGYPCLRVAGKPGFDAAIRHQSEQAARLLRYELSRGLSGVSAASSNDSGLLKVALATGAARMVNRDGRREVLVHRRGTSAASFAELDSLSNPAGALVVTEDDVQTAAGLLFPGDIAQLRSLSAMWLRALYKAAARTGEADQASAVMASFTGKIWDVGAYARSVDPDIRFKMTVGELLQFVVLDDLISRRAVEVVSDGGTAFPQARPGIEIYEGFRSKIPAHDDLANAPAYDLRAEPIPDFSWLSASCDIPAMRRISREEAPEGSRILGKSGTDVSKDDERRVRKDASPAEATAVSVIGCTNTKLFMRTETSETARSPHWPVREGRSAGAVFTVES